MEYRIPITKTSSSKILSRCYYYKIYKLTALFYIIYKKYNNIFIKDTRRPNYFICCKFYLFFCQIKNRKVAIISQTQTKCNVRLYSTGKMYLNYNFLSISHFPYDTMPRGNPANSDLPTPLLD